MAPVTAARRLLKAPKQWAPSPNLRRGARAGGALALVGIKGPSAGSRRRGDYGQAATSRLWGRPAADITVDPDGEAGS